MRISIPGCGWKQFHSRLRRTTLRPLAPKQFMLTDLPNLLTLSRIVAIPLLVVLVALGEPAADLAACVVFSTAAVTDYFDGKVARCAQAAVRPRPDARPDRRQAAGRRGADDAGRPGAAVRLGSLSCDRHHAAGDPGERAARIPRARSASVCRSRRLAKWKTGFQMGALGTLLAGDASARLLHLPFLPVAAIGEAMLWVAAALTLWTGWDYLTAGLRHASGPRASGLPKSQLPSS